MKIKKTLTDKTIAANRENARSLPDQKLALVKAVRE
jgi:hypothetical protein